MPAIKCANCGQLTNSTLSEFWDHASRNGMASKCYARLVNGRWVKGCAYSECNGFQRDFVDNVIKASLRKGRKK